MSSRPGTPSGQLALFGQEPPPPEPAPELVELADRVPANVHFGTCSWTFDGWKGEVYRRPYRSRADFVSRSLAEYAAYPLFRAVEIDSSYYNPLSVESLARYAELVPSKFPMAMKVWQDLTTAVFPSHPRFGDRAGRENRFFLDPERLAETIVRPLEESALDGVGPLLICIPPTTTNVDVGGFEARVANFLARAPGGYTYAFELRDRRLLTRRYLAILRDHGAVHVHNYWSAMPSLQEQLKFTRENLGPVVVARLMLPPGRGYTAQKEQFAPFDRICVEQPQMRSEVLDLLREACERALQVFVFVNNKAEGSAPLTIRALAEAIALEE